MRGATRRVSKQVAADTNAVARAMRPIKLKAKNALFAGCDEGAEN
jgi:transposase